MKEIKAVFLMFMKLAARFGVAVWCLDKSDQYAKAGNEVASLKWVVVALLCIVAGPMVEKILRQGARQSKESEQHSHRTMIAE